MKKRLKFIFIILCWLLFRFLSGICVQNSSFVYAQSRQAKSREEALREYLSQPRFNKIRDDYWQTKPESLISIHTPKDIADIRTRVNQFLWETPELPKHELPAKVERNFQDERYEDAFMAQVLRIDRIQVNMEFGLQSYIYHFIPKVENKKLVLFHQGHKGDFIRSQALIYELLKRDYSVAAFCMPLLGLNNQPTVYFPHLGYLKLTLHDQMKFLLPEKGHPLKYFVQPVVILLNYISQHYHYKHIAMIGISGGAWTTTLASAIDSRIESSFPVAGSYPIYLRSDEKKDWSDWEQTVPEFYRIANYLELYILGAYGKNRSQLQIINKYDSCCFAGVKWKTYEPIITTYLEKLGEGNWSVFMDDSHIEHMISPVAGMKIFSVLETK